MRTWLDAVERRNDVVSTTGSNLTAGNPWLWAGSSHPSAPPLSRRPSQIKHHISPKSRQQQADRLDPRPWAPPGPDRQPDG